MEVMEYILMYLHKHAVLLKKYMPSKSQPSCRSSISHSASSYSTAREEIVLHYTAPMVEASSEPSLLNTLFWVCYAFKRTALLNVCFTLCHHDATAHCNFCQEFIRTPPWQPLDSPQVSKNSPAHWNSPLNVFKQQDNRLVVHIINH